MGNRQSSRTEREMDCALTNNMNNTIRNHLKFKESKKEVKSIKTSVKIMVDSIMREVHNVDSRFEMLRKIAVGSMAEGTRIVKPDEFDFMVVLKHLSTPGIVDIKRDQTHGLDCGFAHVTLRDEESWMTWSDISENGKLRSTVKDGIFQQIKNKLFRKQRTLGLREVFCNQVRTAVKTLFESDFKIHTRHGTLSLENISVEIHGPAVTPSIVWYSFRFGKNMVISVDLVAAIESDIGDLVKVEDAFSPAVLQELQETDRVHLTPAGRVSPCREGLCFQIACSETEIRLIKNLNQNHKMCYKILKDMFHTRNEMATHLIISYVLKTLILEHAYDCSERRMAGKCLMKIVNVIRTNYMLPTINNIRVNRNLSIDLSPMFFKEKNIFLFKENMQMLDAYSILAKESVPQLFGKVERVRKEYPVKPEDSEQNQIRIQVQSKVFATLFLALIALCLPVSYMLSIVGFHTMHQLSNVGLGMVYSQRNIFLVLHFLEVMCRLGRLSSLFLSCVFFLSKEKIILAFISICMKPKRGMYWIIGDVRLLPIHCTAIKRLLLVEETSDRDIWVREGFLNLKTEEYTELWQTDLLSAYYVLSVSFAFLLNMRHRRSYFKWLWVGFTVIVHLSWLYLADRWGQMEQVHIQTVIFTIIIFLSIFNVNMPVNIQVALFRHRFLIIKAAISLAAFGTLLAVMYVVRVYSKL